MNKKILMMGLLVLVAVTACEPRVIMQPANENENTLTVDGTADFDSAPDLAKIQLSVETQSETAQDAQAKNRDVANAVTQALLKSGVKTDEIETTNYNVQKVQEWDPTGQKMVDKGYKASNSFVVTTKNLASVGSIIDTAVQAGVNNVDSISFQLSDDKQREVKADALRRAATNAHEKAQALAEGTGVRIAKVKSVSESNFVIRPYERYDVMSMKAEAAPSAPTPISPGSVTVSAQVNVVYEVA